MQPFLVQAWAMERACALAAHGLGLTAPNPIVGAVILGPDQSLISEGFHSGTDHAEVVAIKAAQSIPAGSTIYVSLEPCAHHGKTPPCVDAIIAAGITNVVFAVKDPNPIAAGGVSALKAAGIAVEEEFMSDLGQWTNRDWLTKISKSRPRFIWKTAITLDGKISAADGSSQWITSETSRLKVAKLRDESDAILIGTATALADNPTLVPKDSLRSVKPVRLVQGEREIPADFNLHNDQAETIFLKERTFDALLQLASTRGWNRVLVESGAALATAMLTAGLIDEIHAFIAPTLLGAGKSFIGDLGINGLADRLNFTIHELLQSGPDIEVIMSRDGVN